MSQISLFVRRFVAALIVGTPVIAMAAITGTVFQDYNGNGQFNTAGTAGATASDRGIAGVTVTAYGLNNAACGSVVTVAAGTYSLTPSTTGFCAGLTTYRLEFTTLPANYLPGARSTDSVASGVANGSGSSTQFAADGATDVNLAINIPCDYCENNPTLSAPRFVGNGLDDQTAALTFPFISGITAATPANGAAELVPTAHGLDLKSQDIGAVWGSSYARQKRTLFFSAFQKRHSAYAKTATDLEGLNGTGRIYFAQKPSVAIGPATVTTTNLLVDLEVLIPSSTTIGGASHSTANNWDDDTVAFARVGRVAFGDVAVSRDETKLYAVSLKDKKIYSIPLSSPIAQVTSNAGISSTDILSLANVPVTTTAGGLGCPSNADLIPGAINVNRYTGDVYFGLTCVAPGTAATNAINSPDRLRAFVYKWDGVAASATQVANFPLNYARQCLSSDTGDLNNCPANSDGEWLPWSDNTADLRGPTGTVYGQVSRPQPWLMNIDFDESNNMILGFIDRLGHQSGNDKGTASVGLVEGISGGDTLKLTPSTTSVGKWDPPAAADFYSGDSYSGTAHGEIGLGGLAYVPGTNQVVSAAFDPVTDGAFRTGGAIWFDNATGAKTRQYMMFGLDVLGTFGKVAGIGDIELLCEAAPIEIGNRVWRDANGNGVQDPGEPGLAGVEVQLIDAASGNVVSTTTTTDTNGEYYFNATNVPDGDIASAGNQPGIKPNTNYIVRVININGATPQTALAGLSPTVVDSSGNGVAGSGVATNDPILDVRDSDAIVSGSNADIAYNSGAAGSNNHGLDFGFRPVYSVGNRIWEDRNGNSTYEIGTDVPLSGAVVELLDSAGNVVATDAFGAAIASQTTNGTGFYRFDNLPAGDYKIRVTPPTGYVSVADGANAGTPNSDTNNDDNGPGATSGAVTSGVVSLGNVGGEPVGEADSAEGQGPTGLPDAQANLTVDFGFLAPTDLSVAKAVTSSGPYIPGSTVTYTVTARNAGPGAAKAEIVVKDQLPAGLTAVSALGTNWACTPQTGAAVEITCTRATAAGALASATNADVITVTATVNTGVASGTSLNNLAQVNPAAGEPRSESNPLGATNGGYETGDPTAGSNNDASAAITVTAATFSIGDLVWNDTNNNGIRDTGETPLSGATVALFAVTAGNPTGIALGTVTTDATGRYRFDGLLAGDYVVVVTPPTGYVSSTGIGAGSTATNELDNGQDTRIATGNPGAGGFRSGVITVGPGNNAPTGESNNGAAVPAGGVNGAGGEAPDSRSNRTVDFGFYQPFDLRLTKAVTSGTSYAPGSTVTYTLTARNLGPGPAGAALVVKDQLPAGLTATNVAGTNWNCTPTTGAAALITCTRTATTALAAATDADVITVTATVDAGVSNGTSLNNKAQVNPSAADVAAGKTELIPLGTADGGFDDGSNATGSNNDDAKAITVTVTPPATFSIGDLVWNDTNNNGIRDTGEAALPGAGVALFAATGGNPTGAALGTVTTDVTGRYRFDGLLAGDYVVVVTPQAGYVSSTGTGSGSTASNELDNGQDTRIAAGNPRAGGFRSGVITLSGTGAATGELNNTAAVAAGSVNGAGGDAADNRSNRTVDFGFYQPFDLTIAKAVTSSGPYAPGATVTYTLTARNLGPGPAGAAIVVKDKLPAGLTAVSALGTNWTCTPQAGAAVEITCTRTATTALASTTNADVITVTATVDAGVTGGASLANLAQVNPSAADVTAGKTEVNPLGATNGGYETGDPTAGSNNDAGATITSSLVPKYALGNRVWFDTNNDGQINSGELGGAGIKVELINPTNSAVLAATVTDANGYYLFDSLDAGNYQVRIPQDNWTGITAATGVPAAAVGSTPLVGYGNSAGATNAAASFAAADNNKDHGTDNATPATTGGIRSATIALGAATVGTGDTTEVATGAAPTSGVGDANDNQTIDFGFYKLAVGNTVWSDSGTGGGTANDGIRNGTEAGIDGVTVQLYEETSPGTFVLVATATTSGGGQYMFMQKTDGNPLQPDVNYQVRIPGGQATLSGLQSSTDPATAATPLGTDSDDQGTGTNPATGVTSTASFQLTPYAQGAGTNGTTSTNTDGKTDQPRVDLGFSGVPPVTYALGNRIWFDTNNDGQLGAGESGIDGVSVQLVDGATGNPITGVPTQTTVGGGYYLFDNLPAGNYAVRVLPSNWTGTGVLAGYQSSTPTNTTYAAGDNNRDHGTNPATAAAYAANGVTSGPINLGAATVLTGEDAGSPNSTVGDANDNRTVDFGFYKLSVGNLVFNDNGTGVGGVTNDGIRNGTEPGIAGVTVQLVDGGGTVVAQTVTDANGGYTFTQATSVPAVGTAGVPNGQPLLPGTYTVRIPANQPPLTGFNSSADPAGGAQPVGDGRDNAPGVTPSTSVINSSPIVLQANGTLPVGATGNNVNGTTDQPRVDFGFNSPAPTFSIGNRVFLDNGVGGGTPSDGIQNGTEPGIPNATVRLLDSGGNPVQTVPTDANGYYRFDNVPAGTYTIEVVGSTLPAGVTSSPSTQPNDRGDKGLDTPVLGNFRSAPVAVGTGLQPTGEPDVIATGPGFNAQGPGGDAATNSTIDFGFVPPSTTYSVGNRVFTDTNNNGVFDAGSDVGIDGVTVRLLDGTGNPVTGVPAQTTTAGGYYLFTNVPSGTYIVEIVPPAGTASSSGSPNLSTGPFEPGSTDYSAAGNNRDHGTAQPNGVIRSQLISLIGLQPTGEGTDLPASITNPAPDDRTLSSVDFGLTPVATLGNLVFNDLNRDGRADPGEPGVRGVVVVVKTAGPDGVVGTADDVIAGTATTDLNGNWTISVPPGTYFAEFTYPPGLSNTVPGTPGVDNTNQVTSGNRTGVFSVGPGATNLGLDAGVTGAAETTAREIPTLSSLSLLALILAMIGMAGALRHRRMP
jgi:uncharacterized repeat protein (TIGR01451 family)/fimbrial isopeptide formation D2 family protein